MACTAIRHVHRMAGAEDPVASETVRQVRRGLMRTYGAAPRRLARPLAVDEIRQIISEIDRTTPIGIRDAAIILLGNASAMRRAEIVGLDLADVEHKPSGLLLTIRKSKRIRMVMVRRSPSLTDSTHSPTRWPRSMPGEQCGGQTPGALFTRIWSSSVSLEPLSPHVPARMLRARPSPPGSTAPASRHTLCGPAMRPPPRWPASPWTGSRRRQDTRTSPSWSTATSGRWKPSRRRRAETSGYDKRVGRGPLGSIRKARSPTR
jgi:integrase